MFSSNPLRNIIESYQSMNEATGTGYAIYHPKHGYRGKSFSMGPHKSGPGTPYVGKEFGPKVNIFKTVKSAQTSDNVALHRQQSIVKGKEILSYHPTAKKGMETVHAIDLATGKATETGSDLYDAQLASAQKKAKKENRGGPYDEVRAGTTSMQDMPVKDRDQSISGDDFKYYK